MSGQLAVFALLVAAFTLSARRLARWYVTAPIAFVAVGLVLGRYVDVLLPRELVLFVAETTLAVLLFHDASQVQPRQIRREGGPVVRLLLIALPLTIAAGFALGGWLFPGLPWPILLLLAAALAPTDAGLGAATVLNPVVPVRVRRLLNVESGLNDGLATPVVLFAIAAAAGSFEGGGADIGQVLLDAVRELGLGAVVGVVAGVGGGLLMTASRDHGWSTGHSRALAGLALPVVAYSAADALHGNGFIAAFVAGTFFAAVWPWTSDVDSPLELAESAADVLGYGIWFIFGIVVSHAVDAIGVRELVFAVLALTVLRMLPVGLSLLGTGLRVRSLAFIGWFGPRGLASLIFALIAVDELRGDAEGPGTAASGDLDVVLTVVATTVLLSVLLHGLSADPLSRRYGAWVDRERPRVEVGPGTTPRTRVRPLGHEPDLSPDGPPDAAPDPPPGPERDDGRDDER
jgi:NhaP-type Na+/H+ or K+/H+ antiporter